MTQKNILLQILSKFLGILRNDIILRKNYLFFSNFVRNRKYSFLSWHPIWDPVAYKKKNECVPIAQIYSIIIPSILFLYDKLTMQASLGKHTSYAIIQGYLGSGWIYKVFLKFEALNICSIYCKRLSLQPGAEKLWKLIFRGWAGLRWLKRWKIIKLRGGGRNCEHVHSGGCLW